MSTDRWRDSGYSLSNWVKHWIPDNPHDLLWESFLRSCLEWEPERRPKAQELLKLELFVDVAATKSEGDSGYIPDIESSDALAIDTPDASEEPLVRLRSCVITPGLDLTGIGSGKLRCFCSLSKDLPVAPLDPQNLRDAGYIGIAAAEEQGGTSTTWLCSTESDPKK